MGYKNDEITNEDIIRLNEGERERVNNASNLYGVIGK